MKTTRIISCVIAIFVALVAASDPDPNTVPACAANCTELAISNQTACASSDIPCLCSARNFNAQVAQCISTTCTVKESLIATRLNARQCGLPIKSRDHTIVVLRTFFLVLSTLLMGVRVLNKVLGFGMKWWWDDYTIIPAYLMAVVFFVTSVYLSRYGIGVDIWDLSFYDITKFLWWFYICAIVYKIEMALAKISVCIFFLRIFPSKNFRIYAITVIALNAMVGILFSFVDGFQCNPRNAAWKGWAKEEPAKCIDFPAAVFANGFVNIALDVIMISLPIFEVLKLKLAFRKKLNAAVMFAMGFILTVIGILRNVNYSHHMRTTNPTLDLNTLHRWALCEVMISVICACLPDLRMLIVRINALIRGPVDTTSTSNSGKTTSHITVTSTFKTDYDVKSGPDDMESYVKLVDASRFSRPIKVRGGD